MLTVLLCGMTDVCMHVMPVLLQMHGDRNCDVCMWHASNLQRQRHQVVCVHSAGTGCEKLLKSIIIAPLEAPAGPNYLNIKLYH